MTPLNRTQTLADVTRDEGFIPYVYDDATGQRVVAGYTLKGKATLAIGWCPQTNPCPSDLARHILGYFLDRSNAELAIAAPWIADLPEPIQRALSNMAFQIGVTGLMAFTDFIPLVQSGHFDDAADDLHETLWWRESGQRAERIEALIRLGSTSAQGAAA